MLCSTNEQVSDTLWLLFQSWLLYENVCRFFTLELVISFQPLQESYGKYGSWITHCWLKTLWEKCNEFGVTVELDDIAISVPREGDKWIMGEFVCSSCYSKIEL